MSFSLDILAFPILKERHRYHTCFVEVPGEAKPVAAIEVIGKYYSYARFCSTEEKAFETTSRLLDKDRYSIITQVPKGYVVWMLEPEGKLSPQHEKPLVGHKKGFCKLLKVNHGNVPTCQIEVSDLDKPLTAIQVSGQFYALLKSVRDREEAVQLGNLMSRRGAKILVTPKKKSFALWIYEPNAKLISH